MEVDELKDEEKDCLKELYDVIKQTIKIPEQ